VLLSATNKERNVIYLEYVFSELRRRRGRTILTALGLGVGIGLVITVSGLSSGLDRAQASVLKPLTGVGTDISATTPIAIRRGADGRPQISAQQRAQLQQENGGQSFDFRSLKPGAHFSRTFFRSSDLNFAASKVTKVASNSDVSSAAGGLTLQLTTISGTVPDQTQQGGFGPPPGGGGGGFAGPRSINFSSTSVSGVDQTKPALGAITSGQVTSGSYFSNGSKKEAILDVAYARDKGLGVGDRINLDGTKFKIVGIAQTPLGGQSSNVYVKLSQLQKLSGRTGKVNTLYVRATSASNVSSVATAIKSQIPGASVTTAKSLADSVSGSLVDAENLTSKLGLVLELVGLLGAILIACLLTLSSVTKRVRELGTLKAIGWPKRTVVRQVTGESLLQGLLGGLFGVLIGLAGAALITALVPALNATVGTTNGGGGGFGFGPFGQGAVANAASRTVNLSAHVSVAVIALAVLLAVFGGLIAGAVGGFRAARLRPADAFRHID
jgi:ABC-type antimicrobial peptide transport system permease subunit